MTNFKITMQYDGGRYKGWQRLGQGENTIQEKIEKVLSELVGKTIEVIGASRSEAGVHALAYVANFKTSANLTDSDIKDYLHKYLPQDISITEVTSVAESFHARYHAKTKTYLYKIWNEEYTNPFMRKYSMHIAQKLNISNMKTACQYFIGEHDITVFANAKSKKKSMVRKIDGVTLEERHGFIYVRVRSNELLDHMVRKIVGTLIQVGLGEIHANYIPKIMVSKEENPVPFTADVEGLYVEKIDY